MKMDRQLLKVLSWLIFGAIVLFAVIPIAINFLLEKCRLMEKQKIFPYGYDLV